MRCNTKEGVAASSLPSCQIWKPSVDSVAFLAIRFVIRMTARDLNNMEETTIGRWQARKEVREGRSPQFEM